MAEGPSQGDPHSGDSPLVRQMAEAVTHLLESLAQVVNRAMEDHGPEDRYKKFKTHDPPAFLGDGDPMIAERWLQRLESIFRVMGCSDDDKVALATYKLQDEAEHWWNSLRTHLEITGGQLTWDQFKTHFLAKYFPQTLRHQKEREFLNLEQRNMTVGQYVAKFEELARYSTTIPTQANEMWKCQRFEGGLKPEILSCVATHQITNFQQLVSICQVAEGALSRVQAAKQISWKRKREEDSSKGTRTRVGDFKGKGEARPTNPSYPRCNTCGRFHPGECWRGKGVCFKCGKPGHYIGQCPSMGKTTQGVTSAPVRGRVYSLDGEQANQSENLIQGTCWIKNMPFKILIDSGATHSFISEDCVRRLNLPTTQLPYTLSVHTPTEDKVITSVTCLSCKLIFQNRKFSVELFCLPMKGLEVILGMDWLRAHKIVIDCSSKTV